MKTIINESLSRNPIQVPDESDLEGLQRTREKLAKEIESIEALNKAKESSDFQKIVLDSYQSMQMIERAAIMLNPKKDDFAVTFAGLQGRWRERMSLTEQIAFDKTRAIRQRGLLEQIGDKITALRSRLQSLKPTQG